MKKIDEAMKNKIQELQMLEQNLQNFLLQKQVFQLELNEAENALEETKKSKGEIFKIVSQIMVKSDKEKIEKELKQRKEIIHLRLSNIEKQEKSLNEKVTKLREEIVNKLS